MELISNEYFLQGLVILAVWVRFHNYGAKFDIAGYVVQEPEHTNKVLFTFISEIYSLFKVFNKY